MQGRSSQAAHTQAPPQAASDGTAALGTSGLATNASIHATSGRRYPRARNQIVQAVKAHAEAVSAPGGDGPAVLGGSLEQTAARAASRRFPRARNPIVEAVGASAGVLVPAVGESMRVEQAAAAAAAVDEGESDDVGKPASAAIRRLDLSRVSPHHNNSVIDGEQF